LNVIDSVVKDKPSTNMLDKGKVLSYNRPSRWPKG